MDPDQHRSANIAQGRELVEHAVLDWLDRLAPLLPLFGARRTSVIDGVLANQNVWMDGETVDHSSVLSRSDSILQRTLLTEEFAAWNFDFRSTGLPLAVLRQLALWHRGTDPFESQQLPALGTDVDHLELFFPRFRHRAIDAVGRSTIGATGRVGRSVLRRRLSAALERSWRTFHSGSAGLPNANVGNISKIVTRLVDGITALPAPPSTTYRERWEAGICEFSAATRNEISAVAKTLNLTGNSSPARTSYDHLLILGGGGHSPLLRAERARELADSTNIGTPRVWLLGSPRPLSDNDIDNTGEWAPDAADEYDLMIAAGERYFPATHRVGPQQSSSDAEHNPDWVAQQHAAGTSADDISSTDARFTHLRSTRWKSGDLDITALSAPTSVAGRRPSTGDTYTAFSQLADLNADMSVLIVTTPMFGPFQYFEALRRIHLPSHATVEVVGTINPDRPETAENLLQEILSTVRSARRCLVSARS